MDDEIEVYVVVRRSKDTAPSMVEIMGIFTNRAAADKWREDIFQVRWVHTEVEKYRVLSD